MAEMRKLLSVRDLEVIFKTPQGPLRAVDGLSFELEAGGSLGIVGESGSGKSQLALALMGLLPRNARVSGSAHFEDQDLLKLAPRKLNRLRGARIGMVFQDPMTSLNPHLTIGTQMAEVLQRHRGNSKRESLAEAERMLDAVRLAESRYALSRYPHEFSGGMRQRITIAMTLLCRPQLLIADEPTTGLDVTVQAQILRLLQEMQRELGLAVILISHDLGVVAELCPQTLVMYAGRMMESGPTAQLWSQPGHPYTRALLAARPRLDLPRQRELVSIPGQPPDPLRAVEACPFQPRCAHAYLSCVRARPPLRHTQADTLSACHLDA
jgi:oligopeptide transport system ATP-binding protein